jgi:hypothetical protein
VSKKEGIQGVEVSEGLVPRYMDITRFRKA